MERLRALLPGALAALVLAGAVLAPPERATTAEAGLPAPLPTQIPIRDINAPPTPNTPATPFTPKPAPSRRRQAKKPRKRPAAPLAAKTAPKAAPSAGPSLEQRYEAPTENIIPLDSLTNQSPAATKGAAEPRPAPGPKPAPVEFPPEPAPAPKAQPPAPAK
ncbi:MAG: hypothetical protein AAGU21_04045 [Solidesulfovibrio sp.]|uniref:hypothetical protein n=1 Tax=Solidesulfovibrio sp. TaxID=2910990 RepID=UPI002B20DA10|nr:hypothetical protein [Solidesulfovibrio sp.]MEA4856462.1 hypothetical protein [Solidesulfovibrio sp.]